MCTEQKATRLHAGTAAGLELTCILFFLSVFFPLLPFPVFFSFFVLSFFLLFIFQSSPRSPSNGEYYKEPSHASASTEWGKWRAGDGGEEGGGMSIGISEKQTWGITVYLVCVCTCWWSLQWGRGNIFRNFPTFGKEEKVEPLLSGKPAAIF